MPLTLIRNRKSGGEQSIRRDAKKIKHVLYGIVSGLLLIVAGSIQDVDAARVIGSGLSSPTRTITFSEVRVPTGTVVTTQFAPSGVTFGSRSSTEGLYLTTAGHPGQGLQNYFPDTYNPFAIKFAQPVTAAAFEMVTNGHTDTFTALLRGVVVESFTHKTGGWAFYGFTGIVFDEIRVHVGQGQHTNDHMRLDNVQIGAAAPAPTASLIVDGGFEVPLTSTLVGKPVGSKIGGWTVIGPANSTFLVSLPAWNKIPAREGKVAVHIGGYTRAGGVSRSFATRVGTTYQISLWAVNSPNRGTGTGKVRVHGGGELLNQQFAAPAPPSWKQSSFSFTAKAPTTTIEIQNVSGGLTIDDVTVTAPAPMPRQPATAQTVNARNVTHVDFGTGGKKLGQFRQMAPGKWIEINADGWETGKLIEESRNESSVVLSQVRSNRARSVWKFDLLTRTLREYYLSAGQPIVPLSRFFPLRVLDILNTNTYPVPVPVVPQLPPIDKSPGFYIVNETDWPLTVSLDQVGCLYHGTIKPGEAFVRDTGAVWFTIKATVNPSGEHPISDWDCAKPIVLITAAALATAASGGWAAYSGIAAASGGGLATFAGSAGLAMTSTTTIVVGATLGGALSGTVLGFGLEEVAIDEIMSTLEINGHASDAGEYAGPPYPFRDAQMPRYKITGGPTIKFNYNLGTPVIDKGTPLTIIKQ